MIYLFTALYCEANIFIRQFHLEKELENTQFQMFYNQTAGIRLTVTGIGGIAAATAVGSVCTEYRPKEDDVLLNVGTSAHTEGSEGIFLCNKIREQVTEKTFYPDILYQHNFCEKALVTGMLPWDSGTGSKELCTERMEGSLYDMEAAAIYQAGSYFFAPHQMIFLKVVSDHGEAEKVSKEQVVHLMEIYQDDLFDFVGMLHTVMSRDRKEYFSQQGTEALVEKFCMDLHCSRAMRDSLGQHIHYLELAGVDYVPAIQEMYRKGLLPCKDKREGKLRFDEFKKRLF